MKSITLTSLKDEINSQDQSQSIVNFQNFNNTSWKLNQKFTPKILHLNRESECMLQSLDQVAVTKSSYRPSKQFNESFQVSPLLHINPPSTSSGIYFQNKRERYDAILQENLLQQLYKRGTQIQQELQCNMTPQQPSQHQRYITPERPEGGSLFSIKQQLQIVSNYTQKQKNQSTSSKQNNKKKGSKYRVFEPQSSITSSPLNFNQEYRQLDEDDNNSLVKQHIANQKINLPSTPEEQEQFFNSIRIASNQLAEKKRQSQMPPLISPAIKQIKSLKSNYYQNRTRSVAPIHPEDELKISVPAIIKLSEYNLSQTKMRFVNDLANQDQKVANLIVFDSQKSRMKFRRMTTKDEMSDNQNSIKGYVERFAQIKNNQQPSTLRNTQRKVTFVTQKVPDQTNIEYSLPRTKTDQFEQDSEINQDPIDQQINEQNQYFLKMQEEADKGIIKIGKELAGKPEQLRLQKKKCYQDALIPHNQSAFEQITQQANPELEVFFRQKEQMSLSLPLLDKIINKTITLQNYTLSEGAQISLALACQNLNSSQVNRIFLDNCGVTGDKFALILNGLSTLKDFKAIVYKLNGFSVQSVNALQPLLLRQIPYHLEELKLIDLKITSNATSDLVQALMPENNLQKLSLVHIQLTDRHFEMLAKNLQQNKSLQHLDLSWNQVRPSSFQVLFSCLAVNNTLTHIVLQWNLLLEDRKQMQIKNKLTPKNKTTVQNICNLIKNSKSLKLLDLSHTGLHPIATMKIVRALRKSVSLQTLHLTGNPNLNNLIDYMQRTLKTKIHSINTKIKLFKNDQVENTIEEQIQLNEDIYRLHQINKSGRQSLQQSFKIEGESQTPWFAQETVDPIKYLSINRKLGFGHLIQDADQWRIHTDLNSKECWVKDQFCFTIFLWSQDIGHQANLSQQEVAHFKSQIDCHNTKIPTIQGQFNHWKPVQMIEFIQFIKQSDKNPPDFAAMLVERGEMRQICLENPTFKSHDEKVALKQIQKQYYETSAVKQLLKLIPFRHPQYALLKELTQCITNKNSDKQKLWLHMDFVKAGSQRFCVAFEDQLYVHKLIGSHRKEEVPKYYITLNQFQEGFSKPASAGSVFSQQDTLLQTYYLADPPDVINLCFRSDYKYIELSDPKLYEQRVQIENLLRDHYEKIKDLFEFAQGQSLDYPKVTADTLYRIVFKNCRTLNMGYPYSRVDFDKLLTATDSVHVHRYRFMELLILTSYQKLTKANKSIIEIIRKVLIEDIHTIQITNRLVDKAQIRQKHVDQILRRNEEAIKKMFQKFNKVQNTEIMNNDYLLFENFVQISNQADLKIDQVQIIQAYCYSKYTVVNEGDCQQSDKQYLRLHYGEYLEALCRLSLAQFQNSEREDDSLTDKLTCTLKQMIKMNTGMVFFQQSETFDRVYSESDGELTE